LENLEMADDARRRVDIDALKTALRSFEWRDLLRFVLAVGGLAPAAAALVLLLS
jgi:hypothetical protein